MTGKSPKVTNADTVEQGTDVNTEIVSAVDKFVESQKADTNRESEGKTNAVQEMNDIDTEEEIQISTVDNEDQEQCLWLTVGDTEEENHNVDTEDSSIARNQSSQH